MEVQQLLQLLQTSSEQSLPPEQMVNLQKVLMQCFGLNTSCIPANPISSYQPSSSNLFNTNQHPGRYNRTRVCDWCQEKCESYFPVRDEKTQEILFYLCLDKCFEKHRRIQYRKKQQEESNQVSTSSKNIESNSRKRTEPSSSIYGGKKKSHQMVRRRETKEISRNTHVTSSKQTNEAPGFANEDDFCQRMIFPLLSRFSLYELRLIIKVAEDILAKNTFKPLMLPDKFSSPSATSVKPYMCPSPYFQSSVLDLSKSKN